MDQRWRNHFVRVVIFVLMVVLYVEVRKGWDKPLISVVNEPFVNELDTSGDAWAVNKKVGQLKGTSKISYALEGRLFSASCSNITYNITTSIVHSFTELAVNESVKLFPYEAKDDMLSSTIGLVRHQGLLWAVTRVWFYKNSKARKNYGFYYQRSQFFVQTFTESLEPVSSQGFLGIPVPLVKDELSGPEDPRIVKFKDRFLIFFSLPSGGGRVGFYAFDHRPHAQKLLKPRIENYKLGKTEKNWCPLIMNDTLYFVYSFDPLQVLKCDDEAQCKFIVRDEEPFNPKTSYLRGGSPFEPYRDGYYLTAAHSKYHTDVGNELNAHFVLLRVNPWQIVYVSDIIRIDYAVLLSTWHPKRIAFAFIYPTGILIDDDDVVNIAANVGNSRSLLIKIRGLKAILDEVIKADKNRGSSRSKCGSIQGYAYWQCVRDHTNRKAIYADRMN